MEHKLQLNENSWISVFVVDGCGNLASNLKGSNTDEEDCFNCAIDGFESLILSQACAGIDITTPEYLSAVRDSFEHICNNLGD